MTENEYTSLFAAIGELSKQASELSRQAAILRLTLRHAVRTAPPIEAGSDAARLQGMVNVFIGDKLDVSIREVEFALFGVNKVETTRWHRVQIGRSLRLAGFVRYRENLRQAAARGGHRQIRFKRLDGPQ